jgi:leucyl/phenylalanyl-tRNA--protein transferase
MKCIIQFPDPLQAEDDGLVAVGGELTTEYLLSAYCQGIFPWYNEGEPVLWWSPNPRMVLYPHELRLSKSLQRTLQSKKFRIKADTNFQEVINRCSRIKRKNQTGTWITKDIISAYSRLHDKGYAHSIETYLDGELVGGLYGISLGKAFFGESMFHEVTDASKTALAWLVDLMVNWDFSFIDVQQSTSHMKSLGARDIPRDQFMVELANALKYETRKGKWSL